MTVRRQTRARPRARSRGTAARLPPLTEIEPPSRRPESLIAASIGEGIEMCAREIHPSPPARQALSCCDDFATGRDVNASFVSLGAPGARQRLATRNGGTSATFPTMSVEVIAPFGERGKVQVHERLPSHHHDRGAGFPAHARRITRGTRASRLGARRATKAV